MPALAIAIVTGPSALSAPAKKSLHRILVPHVDDAGEDPIAPQPGGCALHHVLMKISQRHPATGSVKCLSNAQANARRSPGDDDHGFAEIEAVHARLFRHRAVSLQFANEESL